MNNNEIDNSSVTADINPDEYYPDNATDITHHERFRRKVFKMVSVGVVDDFINQMYDIISTFALVLNIVVTVLSTFTELDLKYGSVFDYLEAVTIAFFALDYILRLYTANCLYPYKGEWKSLVKYYDSLNVIAEVLQRKKQQLMSSVFIILVLMLAASLCMYSIENPYQPDVFANAFSGIWWAASTLLTVGYGDIYPVTTLGKAVGICITFLGVGMVAIPTGIISAGFVEQYSRLSNIDNASESDVHFIKIELQEKDKWVGKRIADLSLPHGMIIAVIQRGDNTVIPKGSVRLESGDKLVLGAESIKGEKPVYLKEIVLRTNHSWNGQKIKDLDISRQSIIIMVKRDGKTIIPKGDLILMENDTVMMYSKVKEKNTWSDTPEQEV